MVYDKLTVVVKIPADDDVTVVNVTVVSVNVSVLVGGHVTVTVVSGQSRPR